MSIELSATGCPPHRQRHRPQFDAKRHHFPARLQHDAVLTIGLSGFLQMAQPLDPRLKSLSSTVALALTSMPVFWPRRFSKLKSTLMLLCVRLCHKDKPCLKNATCLSSSASTKVSTTAPGKPGLAPRLSVLTPIK